MSIQLSFVMPTFNSANYISKTLDSLIASIGEYEAVCEVICVDDGSDDQTVAIIEEYRKKYPLLRVFKESHGGVSAARNVALANVRGKYLTFVDSDDLYAKNFVDYFMHFEQEFDLLFTDVQGVASKKIYSNISEQDKLEIFKNTLKIGEYQIHPGVAGKFFRTAFIKENNLQYNQKLPVAEDILFNFSALTQAQNVILDPVDFYKVTGTHSLMYYRDNNLTGQVEFVAKIRDVLNNYADSRNKTMVENMVILKAMTVYIDRYFGPLWSKGTYSLSQAASLLKKTIISNDYHKAFCSKQLDGALGKRYIIFRKLLHLRQYKLCLIYNRLMDKLRGFNRFKEDEE